MTVSTVIVMAVSLLMPGLIALITKEDISLRLKAFILLFLSTAAGIISSFAWPQPTTLATWGHLGVNILMAFLSAVAADHALWEPTGASKAVHRATDNFGFGPNNQPNNLVK